MVEDIIKRAKAFIGLEEGGGKVLEEEPAEEEKREDIREVLRPKKGKNNNAEYEVMVYEPKVYEDSLQMAAQLRQGNPVVINLQQLDQTEGMRLIDFVCGTAYAIDGHMIKIGESIFLFTPSNILISDFVERGSIGDDIEASSEAARKSFFGA
ncbi:cell division protein SepF [Candidatus Margulisiibacteriota bacterium]